MFFCIYYRIDGQKCLVLLWPRVESTNLIQVILVCLEEMGVRDSNRHTYKNIRIWLERIDLYHISTLKRAVVEQINSLFNLLYRPQKHSEMSCVPPNSWFLSQSSTVPLGIQAARFSNASSVLSRGSANISGGAANY